MNELKKFLLEQEIFEGEFDWLREFYDELKKAEEKGGA